MTSKQLSYRPDIDGLRAVAVLLVIGFHAFPTEITGGYVGVDIFFVISGFLITGLLLSDLEKEQFSFSGFYKRRIRRIFPALVTVLFACFAAGWIFLLPREFTSLGLNIFGGAAFSSNLVLLGETSYFDVAAAQKPLLHLWSLGVEEQFYIVWPMLLLLAFSRRISIIILAVSLLIGSFALNIYEIGTAADFYLPLTRAWELMIGGIMAAMANSNRLNIGHALGVFQSALYRRMPARLAAVCTCRDAYTLIGLGLIAVAVVELHSDSAFPGWSALLPTLGAALIVMADGAWINRVVLANRGVVLVGLISYPLYLWHWPLLSFATVVDPSGLSAQVRLAAIVGALVLAWLTYRWIEQPIRTGRLRPFKIAGLCSAMTAVGAVGLAAFYWQGFSFRIPPAIRDLATVTAPDIVVEWRRTRCLFEPSDTQQFAPECLEAGHRPLLFLWGDSAAASFYPGLRQLQHSVDFGLAQYTTAGCPPLLSFPVQGRPNCVPNDDASFSALSQAHPDIVLLYSVWNYGNVMPNLTDLVAKLHALNIPRIVIMGPPPIWQGGLPKAAYDYYIQDPLHRMLPVRSSFRVDKSWYEYQQQFRNQALPLGTEYISTWDALCNGDECLTRLGDEAKDLMVFDHMHLTVPGAIYLANAIAPCLFPDRDAQMQGGKVSAGVNEALVCPRSIEQAVKAEAQLPSHSP